MQLAGGGFEVFVISFGLVKIKERSLPQFFWPDLGYPSWPNLLHTVNQAVWRWDAP